MTRGFDHLGAIGAPSCPLCGDRREEPLRAHGDFAGTSIYSCKACRHMYCWPEPSADALAEHYRNEYGNKRGMHLGAQYRALMIRRARAQSQLIARFAKAGNCIDIGCGIGALVAQMKGLGWQARGFDGDPEIVKYGSMNLRADISVGTLEEFLSSPASVDLICLSHVLEHFNNMVATLARIVQSVRPGGHVFIEVPNQVHVPEGDTESHLHFFSKESLSKAMHAAGAEVLACHVCGPVAATQANAHSKSLIARGTRLVKAKFRETLGRTEWDGWYDKYHDDDSGIWLRCVARRPDWASGGWF